MRRELAEITDDGDLILATADWNPDPDEVIRVCAFCGFEFTAPKGHHNTRYCPDCQNDAYSDNQSIAYRNAKNDFQNPREKCGDGIYRVVSNPNHGDYALRVGATFTLLDLLYAVECGLDEGMVLEQRGVHYRVERCMTNEVAPHHRTGSPYKLVEVAK